MSRSILVHRNALWVTDPRSHTGKFTVKENVASPLSAYGFEGAGGGSDPVLLPPNSSRAIFMPNFCMLSCWD